MGKTLTGSELADMRAKVAKTHGGSADRYDAMSEKWQRIYTDLAAMLTDYFNEQPALPQPPACLHVNTITTPVRDPNTDEVKHRVHCRDCGKAWWGDGDA